MYREDLYFSIVVPVYNVQSYLEECVQSVLRQTFSDFEMILVDDGSTDGSGVLCDKLAERDSRIRVYHQENQGPSVARNNGLLLARGKYILFLDSDDFYPQKDFLEKVLAAGNEDTDLICFNYARYTDRLLKKMLVFPEEPVKGDALWLELVRRNAYQSSACIKAVKRSLLIDNEITFETGIMGEDIEWCARVMLCARNVAVAPDCVYAYRVRMGSRSKSVAPRYVTDQLKIINRLTQLEPERTHELQRAYNGYTAFQYSTLMINARLSRPRISREQMKRVKEVSWLLRYDENRLVKLIHLVHSVLGFEITSWLLMIYFKLFCK